MKKFVCCIIVFAMAFAMCACGDKIETTEPNEEVDNVKIGLICLHDENSPYDLNFINAFKSACAETNTNYLIKTNIGESNACYEAAAELADSGCNIVFADSFGHEPYIIQAAQDFPEVEFCHATGVRAHTENLPNYHNAFASIYEGRYIDGVALGMKLNEMIDSGEITADEAKVGYVGAMQYAEVISGYTSFFLGVRSVCPSATMLVTFTGTWYDETLEKEAANSLIENGCVVISGHADSMGSPTACESLGVPFVFYNGSIAEACPNSFIVSTRINWNPYFKYIIKCVTNSYPIDTDWVGTFATGSVMMTEVNNNVAAKGTEEAIANLIVDFTNGQLEVFDTNMFTVDGAKVDNYMADIDFDDSYEADTQVVTNGCFHESSFRSAPYFDLLIDGIELMQ